MVSCFVQPTEENLNIHNIEKQLNLTTDSLVLIHFYDLKVQCGEFSGILW